MKISIAQFAIIAQFAQLIIIAIIENFKKVCVIQPEPIECLAGPV